MYFLRQRHHENQEQSWTRLSGTAGCWQHTQGSRSLQQVPAPPAKTGGWHWALAVGQADGLVPLKGFRRLERPRVQIKSPWASCGGVEPAFSISNRFPLPVSTEACGSLQKVKAAVKVWISILVLTTSLTEQDITVLREEWQSQLL